MKQTASEYQEHTAFKEWASYLPDLELLFHIPNGEKRSLATGSKLKKMGVKSGVPDFFLPIARGGFYGLWIELKKGGSNNRPSKNQWIWIERLRQENYCACICHGAEEAIKTVKSYLLWEPTKCSIT